MLYSVAILLCKPSHHVFNVCVCNSDWKPNNCTLVDIILVDEVMDCRGIDSFKCLRVLVNSSTEKTLQLYYDEDPVKNKPKVPLSV